MMRSYGAIDTGIGPRSSIFGRRCQASVAAAQAAVDKAQLDLGFTKIISPSTALRALPRPRSESGRPRIHGGVDDGFYG